MDTDPKNPTEPVAGAIAGVRDWFDRLRGPDVQPPPPPPKVPANRADFTPDAADHEVTAADSYRTPDAEHAARRDDARETNAAARARQRRPQWVVDAGAADWAPFTVTVAAGGKAFLLAPVRPGRRAVVVSNSGTGVVFLQRDAGDAGTETGPVVKLAVGATVTFTHRGAVYARGDAAGELTGWLEYDYDGPDGPTVAL